MPPHTILRLQRDTKAVARFFGLCAGIRRVLCDEMVVQTKPAGEASLLGQIVLEYGKVGD